jgi:hypothetical protein
MYFNDHDLNAGDAVQLINHDDDDTIKDGTVVSITPAKRKEEEQYWKFSEQEQEDMRDHALVKWEDGTESEVVADDLEPRDSELERDFRVNAYTAQKLINAKMAEAEAAVDEACKIAEQYGVSFGASVSPLSQTFKVSLPEKYEELDSDFVQNICDVYGEYDGWQHSAVC